MKTAYVGKIWFSSYGQKRSLPIRFQYSLVVYLINQLTSEVYFLHVDRHEWTQQGWLNSFLKKNSLLRQKGHFGPKNGAFSYFWIHSKDFFEILHKKGAKRYMKIRSMVFPKAVSFWASGQFWAQKWSDFFLVWFFF